MQRSTPEQVAAYLARVAGTRDITQLLKGGAGLEAGGLESMSAPETAQERSAADGVQKVLAGSVPSIEQSDSLEAIVLPKIRPVLDVVDGDFHTDHPLWVKLNTDAAIRGALQAALPSIGRIELPGNPKYPYGGTGFVVGDGLIMTNRHVASIFSSGVGTRVAFRPGLRAGIDFVRELDRQTGPTFVVKKIVMVHPYWDMAILEVEGLPATAKPLRLVSRDAAIALQSEVAAIGYPAFDTRNDATVQNDLFRKVFGVKRLQPGTLDGRGDTESFGKMVSALRHNCSTLGGNSGSALVDFATGQIVALHFGGRYSDINYSVPTPELAKDPRVIDAGVHFEPGAPAAAPPTWEEWWTNLSESAPTVARPPAAHAMSKPSSAAVTDRGRTVMSDGTVDFVVPLHITVRIGDAAPATAAARVTESESEAFTERLVMPFHDEEYDSRKGYDPRFIGEDIPMPESADPSVLARAKDGSTILPYQNFSIAMHAKRRLALFTASNVTAASKLKRPDPDQEYSRKALSGLGQSDQEKWFADPRLDDSFQLPDVFYTRDDGAFDKGHIVRREDVAWGESYDLLRRANGDTYHVTNCSPQVAGFNRATLGEDNWGELENVVLKGAASERYCQFAGPVLDPADETFIGAAGGRQKVRVKIPSRFWKVIVTRTSDGIAAYGFLLEQDLSDVPLEEFVVPESFVKFMEPLADLQRRAGIRFPDVVLRADQFSTTEGAEVAMRSGFTRRSQAEGVVTEALVV
jgi:endonuclease G, mitochondrial